MMQEARDRRLSLTRLQSNRYEDSSGDETVDSGRLNLSRFTTNQSQDYDTPRGSDFLSSSMVPDVRHGEVQDSVPSLETHNTREGLGPYSGVGSQYGAAITLTPTAMSSSTQNGWVAPPKSRSRTNSFTGDGPPSQLPSGLASPRPQRPTVGTRTPSHAYAPQRRPGQYPMANSRHRSSSQNRSRLNAEAEYRAQKKAYVQRLQQENLEDFLSPATDYPPSLGYSTDTETDGESPATDQYVDGDPYDQEQMLYYGNEDMSPSAEELKIPANRERLEWHSMLANVLTGDVVRQEKKRMTGGPEQQGDQGRRGELWLGIRSRVCGRPLATQKRMVEDQRAKIPAMVEEVIAFEIKGEMEVRKSAEEQVADMVKTIEQIESLYPSTSSLGAAHPRTLSEDYFKTCAALYGWRNTTQMINTELGILKTWVGNDDLDFSKTREPSCIDDHLTEHASFIDRLLKEDGLKSLQMGSSSLLVGVEQVILKSKAALIENAGNLAAKHLPPYIEEMLTLINFPSRLVQEIIRTRLTYAQRMKDSAQQSIMMMEQMISQFQILLNLAIKVKESYTVISQPEPGWDLPPCIDENIDTVVLDALKFYFKMLNWKLSANKNTFKEAEILEQEWDFSKHFGRHFEGGDTEVAEQFSALTAKSLFRLTSHFEKELQRRPSELAEADMDRRYKQILDSVRVRQRKLFRFSRLLTQAFENTTEFNINVPATQLQELYGNLIISGHLILNVSSNPNERTYFIASPSLAERAKDIKDLLGTCYKAQDGSDYLDTILDPFNPYVLIVCPEEPLVWDGRRQSVDINVPKFDIKPGKLRLIATGAKNILANARTSFSQATMMELDVIVPQRANLPRVDRELQRIKRTTYKLSEKIMDSVGIIRKQTVGLKMQELIQTCFAFATEFGQRSVLYMDYNRRALNNLKLTRLALDWVSFICDDCQASDRKTFRWAVVALEFAAVMTRGQNILSISDEEYAKLRSKVAGCMSLLISHFDIMGARSTVAAQAEKQRMLDTMGGHFKIDVSKLKNDEESSSLVRHQWMEQLEQLDEQVKTRAAERRPLGRVLEDSNEADRSLTVLSSSVSNATLRWQQGQFIGGGTFGSVYAAINLDSGILMAVKEIRLQDPQMIPTIVTQIRDEMNVLQILDHPNIVSYYGIEVHRDKVYIFMEYCSGGSLAALLEHGRIEDETVIMVYALQMLEGLAYLHESGVVHRDIKPENILLDHNGVIKFVDFGAAKVIARQSGNTIPRAPVPGGSTALGTTEARLNRGGNQQSMTGTPMYMSPETITGSSQHISSSNANVARRTSSTSPSVANGPSSPMPQARPAAADTWSLGCVILEMATGRRPWSTLDNEWAIMYNIANGTSPALPSRDQLSDAGIDFLKRCFERDPTKRATAAELLQSDWIMTLRNQLSLESQPVLTPSSETASSSSYGNGSGFASLSAVTSASSTTNNNNINGNDCVGENQVNGSNGTGTDTNGETNAQ